MPIPTVDLFTLEEQPILADWLNIEPPKAIRDTVPEVYDALETLGYVDRVRWHNEDDAAVAAIVLERVQRRLPQWAGSRIEPDGTRTTLLARDYRPKSAERKVELMPQRLLTIDWASTAPGYGWPVEYNVTYVPVYDRHIITASADSREMFGYADIAIGSCTPGENLKKECKTSILLDWQWQHREWDQQRWQGLETNGLIAAREAEAMADLAWFESSLPLTAPREELEAELLVYVKAAYPELTEEALEGLLWELI
jgi:hypothetical protein